MGVSSFSSVFHKLPRGIQLVTQLSFLRVMKNVDPECHPEVLPCGHSPLPGTASSRRDPIPGWRGLSRPDSPVTSGPSRFLGVALIRRFFRKQAALALLLAFLAAVGGYAAYAVQTGNLHVIREGLAYRSGQLDPGQLERASSRWGFRSIVNLRGGNPGERWYQDQIQTASRLGLAHFDWRMGSGDELSRERMDELVKLLQDVPKPVLIHCDGGADRSGLVSALYQFAVLQTPPDRASQALSIWFGHAPWIRPKVAAMDRSFWNYAAHHAPKESLSATSFGSD
ncbi:MAG: hypothetical protein FJ404_11620 [Verrucomicrobia bacterium]|nr:hypothetical protein [Verrucomicrobiota bacterium]